MELELFKIHVSYHEKNQEQINEITGFAIDDFGIWLDKRLSEEAKIEIINKWHYTKCSLLKYKKFEIDRLPKNLPWFKRLIFYHFNYLVSKNANQVDVKNNIEAFLDEE